MTRAAGVKAILVLGIAFLLAAATAAGAAPRDSALTAIPAPALRDDAALLRDALETLHPGLFRYLSPRALDAAFGALEAGFAEDRTLGEAFRAFTELTATLKCGHTWPSFFNQSEAVEKALFQGPRVPFTFRWIDRRMIVTGAFARADLLRPGTEIVALGGVSPRTILWTLMPVVRADGANDARRIATLEVTGGSRYEAFDVYYPLYFPMRRDSIAVTIRRPGAKTHEVVTLALMTDAAREAATRATRRDAPAGPAPVWSHEWRDERTMILRMPTWAIDNSTWDWKAALAHTFAELDRRRASTLIVDLRGNEGGNEEVGRELLARIATSPIRLESLERKYRYRTVPERLLPHLRTGDPSFKDWGNRVMEAGDGFYRMIQSPATDDVVEPAPDAFAGEVWVLVDATNSSATFQFAQAAQSSGRAKLVGQPTGGNQRGINGGAFCFVTLPGSGLEIDLPLVGYFPPAPRPDGGLTPDLPVRPTVDAIVRGADAELEAVMDRRAADAARRAKAAARGR